MIFEDLIFKFTFFKKMSIEKQGKTEGLNLSRVTLILGKIWDSKT